jgi:hypothetical protein
MKRDGIFLILAISGFAVVTTTQAITDGANPYDQIAERNVFSLKPPPPPASNEPPPTPAPKITLQGITSILGKRQVLFRVAPAKPGEKEESFILTEGEGQNEIDVQAIDLEAGTVTFKNHGSVQTLSMDKDAAVVSTTASSAIPTPTRTIAGPGRIGGVPGASAPGGSPVAQPGLRTIPTRPTRGGNNASSTPTAAVAPAIAVQAGVVQQNNQQANQPPLSNEEQVVLIEVNRELSKEKTVAGELPPLPPTELTPPGSTGIPDESIPSPGQ